MQITKQLKDIIGLILGIGAVVGLITTSSEKIVERLTRNSRQQDAKIELLEKNQELLIHSANHSIEVDIALMDKVRLGKKYYITDDGGALAKVMLFQTNDSIPGVFVLVPDTTMLYTLHILQWDDSREEWEYVIDEVPIIIYER